VVEEAVADDAGADDDGARGGGLVAHVLGLPRLGASGCRSPPGLVDN
jgi:hypothetical protein